MQRSQPLRRRSKKTSSIYRTQRIPLVIELLADQPPCQRCQQAIATEVHEIKSRARGGSILDRDNLACLCHTCHAWITTHPAAATEEGWLKHSWDD